MTFNEVWDFYPFLAIMITFGMAALYGLGSLNQKQFIRRGIYLLPVSVFIWSIQMMRYDAIHDKTDFASGHPMFSATPVYFLLFLLCTVIAAVPTIAHIKSSPRIKKPNQKAKSLPEGPWHT